MGSILDKAREMEEEQKSKKSIVDNLHKPEINQALKDKWSDFHNGMTMEETVDYMNRTGEIPPFTIPEKQDAGKYEWQGLKSTAGLKVYDLNDSVTNRKDVVRDFHSTKTSAPTIGNSTTTTSGSFSSAKKDTNPKDAIGIKKAAMSTVSGPVMMEVGIGMLEGACKYGRHNYREAGVRASVYYDAVMRHMMDWWEGTDIDPDSGLNHITKAITSLVVLRDSMIRQNWADDRPPKTPEGWLQELNQVAAKIMEKYPNPVPAYTEKQNDDRK